MTENKNIMPSANFEVWDRETFKPVNAETVQGHTDVLFGRDKLEIESNTAQAIDLAQMYKSEIGTTVAIGGIPVGWKPPTEGIKILELIDQMMHPYVIYTWSFATSPGGAVREKGSSVNSTTLTANYSVLSTPIKNLKFYANNVLIQEFTSGFGVNGSKAYTHAESFNQNMTFKADITDGQNARSLSVSHTFVHPAYVGALDAGTAVPNSAQIKAMTKKVQNPGNLEYTYTITNKRMAIACPPGWTIAKIFDPNNFDVTASFAKHTVSVTCLDNTNQSYNVYVSEPTTQTNFKVKFNR